MRTFFACEDVSHVYVNGGYVALALDVSTLVSGATTSNAVLVFALRAGDDDDAVDLDAARPVALAGARSFFGPATELEDDVTPLAASTRVLAWRGADARLDVPLPTDVPGVGGRVRYVTDARRGRPAALFDVRRPQALI